MSQIARGTSVPNQVWYTNAWEGKFLYGAMSTLISSWYIGKHSPVAAGLVQAFQRPRSNEAEISELIVKARTAYEGLALTDNYATFESIVAHSRSDDGSIFDAGRDFCLDLTQNQAFMEGMERHPELKPIDNFYDIEYRYLVQLNVHRGLYHNAWGIPQNSIASVFNAYLAGIRSVEFDVLESKDYFNLVIHDLVTNRLDGNFMGPPIYTTKWDASELLPTRMEILNPLAESPTVEPTGAMLAQTSDLLWAVRKWMPELTLYADARNSASVSLIRLIYGYPDLKPNLVIKVYPFELAGGVYDIVTEYARRYTGNDIGLAKQQIRSANPNFLLAMGGLPNELNERLTKTSDYELATEFTWGSLAENKKAWPTILPFTFSSELTAKNGKSYNEGWGAPIFTTEKLDEITARSYLFARWAIDFSAIGTVRIFQLGLIPSLVGLINSDNRTAFDAMPESAKFSAAIFDNFFELFKAVERMDIYIYGPDVDGTRKELKQLWRPVVFGGSDRYPDFAFAQRKSDGAIDQDTLQHFYYSMDGLTYTKDDYGAQITRSSQAVVDALLTWPYAHAPGDDGGYVTTDLPTDLRTKLMNLSGTLGFPEVMHYRVGGMIREQLNPPAGGKFVPRQWSKQLFGTLRSRFPNFAADYDEIKSNLNSLKVREKARSALNAFHSCPEVLVNGMVLDFLEDVAYRTEPLSELSYSRCLNWLDSFIVNLNDEVLEQQKTFAATYGVNFDGTPVAGLLDTVLRIPEGEWDH